MSLASLLAPTEVDYSELRLHELRKTRMVMVDGNLTVNSSTTEAGTSARVWQGGYWGYAAMPGLDRASAARVTDKARTNARTMGHFGERSPLNLPEVSYQGEHRYQGRSALSQQACQELLRELHAYCRSNYPDLKSTIFVLHSEDHRKQLTTSTGSRVLNSIQRAACYIVLVAEDGDANPVELMEIRSCKGGLADLGLSISALAAQLDRGQRAPESQVQCSALTWRQAHNCIGA